MLLVEDLIMRNTIRGKKIMFTSKKRITPTCFLVSILLLGGMVAPSSYAEDSVTSSVKTIYGPVKGSDTLGKIVAQHYSGSNLSQQQIMIGILRANPDAFIGRNIHFLLKGSTLRLPSENLISTIDQTEATNTIKEHYNYFKRGQTGNFKIKPLENLSSDKANKDDGTNIVISSQDDKKIKVDEIKKVIQSGQKTPPTATTINKKPITTNKTKSTNNTIKDIELESLKIKVSQLENILSQRGLSTTTASSDKDLQNILNSQKQKINQLELEKKNKTEELDSLRKKISSLELSLEKMTKTLSQDDDGKGAIITQLRKDNSQLQKKLTVLQAELDKKSQEVEALNLDIANSKQKIEQLETKILSTNKENALLDQQIAEMEAKLKTIRQTPTAIPATNTVTREQDNHSSSFNWIWLLLPAFFLLSILGYLFKRSFSQSKEAVLVTEAPLTKVQDDFPPQPSINNRQPSAAAIQSVPDIVASASEEESVEASIKLDIARAYMDMDMSNEAIEILEEIPEEGSQKQCLEARNLLEKLVA